MPISPTTSFSHTSNTVRFGGIKRKVFQGLAIPLLILPSVAGDAAPKAASIASPSAHSAIGKVERGLNPFIERLKPKKTGVVSQANVFCQNGWGSENFTMVTHKIETPQDPVGATQAALNACRAEGKLPNANITIIDTADTYTPFNNPNWQAYRDRVATITPNGTIQEGQLLVQVHPVTKQITSLNMGLYDAGPYGIKTIGTPPRQTKIYQFDDTNTVGFENGRNRVKFTPSKLKEVPSGYFTPSNT